MRRKRIALFANAWGSEFIQELGYGMKLVAEKANADIFAFVNYSSHEANEDNQKSEMNIFCLPDLKDFDGAVVLAGSFNTQMENDYVQKKIVESGIPAISVESEMEGLDFIATDDYVGMHELAAHIMVDHGVKNIMFMGGIREHHGSQIRLKAVLDVAKENGISIPDENILYGDFAAAPATRSLEEWCMTHNHIPEAIICANDVMAVGICDWLKSHNYDIPGDVLVTGFDCIQKALTYEPQITSVNGEWVALGSLCMENLIKKINGKNVSACGMQSSKLIKGCSCGCDIPKENGLAGSIRRKISRENYVDGFVCDQHFRHMYLSMRKAQTKEDLNYGLSTFFANSNWLEGSKVVLALNPEFFMIEKATGSMNNEGYPEAMDIVCNVFGEEIGQVNRVKTKESIFIISNRCSKPDVYIFVPTYTDGLQYGYAMLSKGFSITQNDILYIWTRHLNNYLEQVRLNVEIRELNHKFEMMSLMEGLTNSYNRYGCNTVVKPALEEAHNNGKDVLLIMIDVDRLKKINDGYGHDAGDAAIRACAGIVRKVVPEDFMICRFGGDEFMVAGAFDEKESEKPDVEAIFDKVQELSKTVSDKYNFDFQFSISLGAKWVKADDEFDFTEALKQADIKMYEMKKKHHEAFGE